MMVRPDAKYILIRYSRNFQITTQVSPGLLSYSESIIELSTGLHKPQSNRGSLMAFLNSQNWYKLECCIQQHSKVLEISFLQSAITLRNGSSIWGLMTEKITTVYLWVAVRFFNRTWPVLQLRGLGLRNGSHLDTE